MLFTNRAYTKHQDIHDQESFRKSGFINRLDVFLKFNKTDKVEQFGERSAIQAHANIIFG